tara:strand:+ start:3277 stop:4998 length:1722 start_codon:yes stop_codon:yes gene_type:complete
MADIQVTNTDADLSDNTLLTEENAYTITGLHTFSRSTNAPFAVNSGAAVVANLDADKLDGIEATGFVKANGTVALTADWDAGGYEIRAQTLEADVSTGTAPLTIASTTKVANLNADKLDDQEGSYYLAAGNVTGTLAVGSGGTGATSLTDGGVLLGSGTGAVTAMAVLADGEMIVGDGTTDPVAESGATLRTSIGVGTGDSPQFTGIELGHATDTTLTKASSGDVNIEGNIIYRAGGTDVPVADGGTGVSTLTDGGVLLGNGTGDIQAMAVLADGEMIVGDGTTDPVAESGSTLRASIGCDAAGNITSGTVATARLGSGTASSGTFLRGDSSWAAPSATSAAGSDTQVQYNDGGSSFGGDAGLVYNDSTNVLTAGKLATTDTSATSIDVAGGITAGTGNVAIVNAAGKIPEISSTYFADLSGANLTGISAGKILQVHNFVYTAQVGSTSSTFATTNVLDKITLADTDNKVLVMVDIGGLGKSGNTSIAVRLQRAISGGATTTVSGGNFLQTGANTAATGTNYIGSASFQYLDDPTTTSELTYTVEFSNVSNASNTYVMLGNGRGSITLMEVEV